MFFLSALPPYPFELTLILNLPSLPGGMSLGKETAVHPQPVFTFSILRGAVPLF